ncbi:hypothetical protein BCR37DRAFT_380583, partial [Protomyces lactucae-debilis]
LDDRKMPAVMFKETEQFSIAQYCIVVNLRRFIRLPTECGLRSTLHNEDLCGALTTSHFAS